MLINTQKKYTRIENVLLELCVLQFNFILFNRVNLYCKLTIKSNLESLIDFNYETL